MSDECLALRVVEYGRTDDVGKDAMGTLNSRGPSAVAGVADKMEEVRVNWPPAARTVNGEGIHWLLRFLKRNGHEATEERWSQFDYEGDLMKVKHSGVSGFTGFRP